LSGGSLLVVPDGANYGAPLWPKGGKAAAAF